MSRSIEAPGNGACAAMHDGILQSARRIAWPPAAAMGVVLLGAVVAGGAAGCGGGNGPPLGNVSGTVTLDGKPLADVEVCFAPARGRASIGRTDGSGRYALTFVGKTKGALVGAHRVSVNWPLGDPEDDAREQKAGSRPPIPDRYSRQSTLTADVRGGSNTFDFALESK